MAEGAPLPPRGLLVGAVVLVLATFALQVAGFHGTRYDDAFITYRYGANLATGHGLVFNPGERLMGSTSPLHSLLAAPVYLVAGEGRLPGAMSALGCAGWTAQAVAVFVLLRAALGGLPALLVASAVAAGAAGSARWVPLETNLVAAFALWALVAALASRWVAAALLLALAGLTRPDAYLLALPLGLLALPDLAARRVGWWRPVLAFALPTALWLVFAGLYFGSVVPQSALAKVGRTAPSDYFHHLLIQPPWILLGGRDGAPWIALVWLLAAAGAALLIARRRRLWVLPAWGALHFAGYWTLRPFAAHRWQLYPLVLVVVVCAFAALAALARRGPRRLVATVAAAGLGALVLGSAVQTAGWARGHRNDPWYGSRHRVYQRVAEFLVAHGCRREGVVAAVEVGTVGYYGGCRMFDLGGLVTPLQTGVWREAHPDWFVLDPLYLHIVPDEKPVEMFWDGGFRAFVFATSPLSRGRLGLPPEDAEPASEWVPVASGSAPLAPRGPRALHSPAAGRRSSAGPRPPPAAAVVWR
jgi:hypothetical protein